MNTNKFYILLTLLNVITICKRITAANTELIIERVEVLYLYKNYAEFNITIKRLNRFDYGFTLFLNLIKEKVTYDDYITIQLYTFHNNEYRLGPLQIHKTICSFMDLEWQFVTKNLENYGNFPSHCPIVKGLYYVKDYVSDGSNFPDVPWSNMRFDVNFSTKNIITGHVRVYIKFNKDARLVNKFLSQSNLKNKRN